MSTFLGRLLANAPAAPAHRSWRIPALLVSAALPGCVFISAEEYDWRSGGEPVIDSGTGGTDSGACQEETWYPDSDNDGYGSAVGSVEACEQPNGYVSNDADCDDSDASVSAGLVYFADEDGDGYGDADSTLTSCDAVDGYVSDATDCDDANAAVSPGELEDCSTEADDNCDDDTNGVDAVGCVDFYADGDSDGYGAGTALCMCAADDAYDTELAGDCDDSEPLANPGETEVCGDGIDNDCDGSGAGCGLSGEISLSDADLVVRGASSDASLGDNVSRVGDQDGDGWPDVLLGAYGDSTSGTSGGAGFVVPGTTTGEVTVPGTGSAAYATASGDGLGRGLSGGPDFDADGGSDLALGAPSSDGGGTDAGTAYVLFGPVSGASDVGSMADLTLTGDARYDYFGRSLALLPDLTGDGVADLVVGASGDDEAGSGSGTAYLFAGGVSGALDAGDAAYTITGVAAGDGVGKVVVGVGDMDGDGTQEFALGVVANDDNGTSAGGAFFFGNGTGQVSTDDAMASVLGAAGGDLGGGAIAPTGDVDGDGYDDVVVGATGAYTDAGAAYVVLGPLSGSQTVSGAWLVLTGQYEDDAAGAAVASGDFDGSGGPDLAVGAPGFDGEGVDSGVVYLVYDPGGGTLGLGDADALLDGENAGDWAGSSLAVAGDTNGDSADDLLVGAPGSDSGGSAAGSAYLILGGGL